MRPCLLVIDLLNDYLDRWDSDRKAKLLANTNNVAKAFRVRGFPIIWVRQEFRADLSDAFLEMRDKDIAICIEGTRGAEIHDDLDRAPDDLIVVKKPYSAFFGTGLDDILERRGVDEIVLCGINTHACIRTTAIDAYQRDLRVTLLLDCIDTYDEPHAKISLDYMDGKIARLTKSSEIIRDMSLESRLPSQSGRAPFLS
jgi:nicotinamidase-related amidase